MLPNLEGTPQPPLDLTEYTLDQLSTFHRIGAYILGVFSLCGLPHTFFGLVMLVSPTSFGSGKGAPPAFLGGVFMGAGLFIVLSFIGLAIANYSASTWIRERQRMTAIQVVAAFDCLHMPLGTLLGVYSLVTLSKPEVKARFRS